MQSTQSTGTVFFRAVVMVGFLAVIFYAAVSGNALPDAARKQLEKYLPRALLAGKSANAENANAASAASSADEAPLFNDSQANKTPTGVNSALPLSIPNQAPPRKLAVDSSASLLSVPSGGGTTPVQVNNNLSPVVPVNYQTPAEIPSGAATPFSQIQDRLKQLGATYYLLETWGNQQQLFRFYCKMAVGGNANYTHCFEYIGADPLQAMSEVLKQVENWRNGGSVVR
jgi:hypothetical protein